MKGRYHILAGSLLVAALFWFSVTMGDSYRTRVDIPLVVVNMPRDVALADPLPETISVLLQANGWQLLFLTAGREVAFEVTGEQLRRGIILPNRSLAEMMKLPPGVQALRAYPDTIFVSIDRYEEKKVPIDVSGLRLSFKEGFGLVRGVQVTPDSVLLRGSERVLRGIRSWPIEDRSYDDLTIPVAEDIPLFDSLHGVISFNVDKATVYIPTEQLADMFFNDVPISIRGKHDGGEVLLARKTMDIAVRGGVNVLSGVSIDDFKIIIDYDDLVADTSGSIIPTIHLPAGLQLLKVDPAEIRYTLRK